MHARPRDHRLAVSTRRRPRPAVAGALLAAALAAAVPPGARAAPAAAAAPAAPAAGTAREPNLLGMNVGAPLDWEGTRLYADAMRTARSFQRLGGGPAAVDRDGWPTEDFEVVVWHGAARMNGSYALSFRGRAHVTGGYGKHELTGVRYDPATNLTTATVRYEATDAAGFLLKLTATQRSAKAPPGSGVTELRLMRPVAPGAARSLPPETLWNPAAERLLGRFQVIRYMDFLATNNSQLARWGDRPRPRWPSFNRMTDQGGYGWQGIGGPLEHVILLSNRLHRDAWITVPAKAPDEYVRKVALLFRYGSDGDEPYAAPQAAPAFPPLDPALKLYVEYSNEVWNGAGSFQVQFRYNHDRALAEAAQPGSPLAFDGTRDEWALAWRRIAQRTVEISKVFREVFGDAQMMTRVRPVLMTQQGDGQETLTQAARLLHGYHDNGEGEFVAVPRPPSWYVYGIGGSGYYNPENDKPLTLDTLWSSRTMALDAFRDVLRRDADRAAALGLRRVCYEGGPSLDRGGPGDPAKSAAVQDPRMREAVVAHHDAWSEMGGELFVYFTAVGDYQWGFTPDLDVLETPKLRAIEELRARPRAPVRHGALVPATVEGNRFAFGSRGWDRPGAGSRSLSKGRDAFQWASYTFRGPDDAPGKHAVSIRTSGRRGARVAAYWDGALLGIRDVPWGGGTQGFGTVPVGPGLHGLVVRAVEGEVIVEAVEVR